MGLRDMVEHLYEAQREEFRELYAIHRSKIEDQRHQLSQTMEISEAAKSGDGTVDNVGIKMTGTFQCPECRQKFDSQKALDLHLKFQCSTAIAKQINPIGD